MSNTPIGIFDSGIGGLTVAKAIRRLLPRESTIYFGDTARVPYGPKSPETVRRYAREILDWLLGKDVKAIVVACNTVTAHALDDLRERSPVPVIGVIEPGARAAAGASVRGTVGVIGTAGTIASAAYPQALRRIRPELQVIDRACPLFVPLVEEGWFDHEATRLVAEEYLAPLRQAGVDVLVLGCTHYPMLKPLIRRVMGDAVQLIDSAEETAAELANVLGEYGLAAAPDNRATQRWVATDDAARFTRVGAVFMGGSPAPVEIVELGGDVHSGEGLELHP
jgi:glutamate racemase